ncbi:hypothetical protein PACTADRAFT_35346 [Pachysolen tannophilus NRRL Y-2460]|uniref:Alkaline ceramidase n=1 Tax=Pachysolen tannophilus NRRL Y-2460 TaxID=669874 RepID=A0A1E4TP98_PACTA|nr:hypothetical protein PACTADRAFT_35346 [Pachysolen tannophilus NRRL Y-2460]
MSSFPLFTDYPLNMESYQGYWGPVTSTIDWCEENYVISPFFAEFINATTNLSFFFLSMYHLYSSYKNNHGLLFMIVSIGMGIVGLGSWLFHMTLKYEFQLLDELPMIFFSAIPFAYIHGIDKSNFIKFYIVYLGTFIIILTLTLVYCSVYTNPILHQTSYAILNISIVVKSLLLVNKHVTSLKIRKYLYWKVFNALSQFMLGFLFWNLDTIFCSKLIFWRRNLFGLPLGFLLEGHGWWHIFTSLGIYNFILYNEILSIWFEKRQNDYKLVYRFGILGEVVLINGDKTYLDKFNGNYVLNLNGKDDFEKTEKNLLQAKGETNLNSKNLSKTSARASSQEEKVSATTTSAAAAPAVSKEPIVQVKAS